MASFHFMSGNSTCNPMIGVVSPSTGFYPGASITPISSIHYPASAWSGVTMQPQGVGIAIPGQHFGANRGFGGFNGFVPHYSMDPMNDVFVDQNPRPIVHPSCRGTLHHTSYHTPPHHTSYHTPYESRTVVDHAPHTVIYDAWGNPTAQVHRRVTVIDHHPPNNTTLTQADLLNHRAGLSDVANHNATGINVGRKIIGYRSSNGQPLYQI
jgi:hypothetical protein